jgi:hypothetical protein
MLRVIGSSVIELLIYRCSTPCSVMHTAATVIVPHTANGVAHDKSWAMEDAVYSSRPRFINLYGSAWSQKKRQESSSQRQILHWPGAVNHQTCPVTQISALPHMVIASPLPHPATPLLIGLVDLVFLLASPGRPCGLAHIASRTQACRYAAGVTVVTP